MGITQQPDPVQDICLIGAGFFDGFNQPLTYLYENL